MDPAPPGHVLPVVLEHLPEEDERETSELLDLDPAPPDPLPSTMRIVCVLHPAFLANADLRRPDVGSFGKNHSGGISSL